MGLWIYLSGVILSVILVVVMCLYDWYYGKDVKFGPLLGLIAMVFTSWFLISLIVVFAIVSFLREFIQKHYEDVVIKGRKH